MFLKKQVRVSDWRNADGTCDENVRYS